MKSSVIDLAVDKKFTEFSEMIKGELTKKLANHQIVKDYVSEFDKLQNMKSTFSEISNH